MDDLWRLATTSLAVLEQWCQVITGSTVVVMEGGAGRSAADGETRRIYIHI